MTISPNVSMTANSFQKTRSSSVGLNLATSYNSRYGIKELQISEQMSFSKYREKAEKNKQNSSSVGANIASSTISLQDQLCSFNRMPITNEAWAGHFQLGGAIFGVYGSAEVEVYKQTSKVSDGDVVLTKPMFGYMYYQKAQGNANAVMDFSRLNDKEVTPATPVISVPQYAYDVFSIQGEGTGGTMRAYRNDQGTIRDNYTRSQDKDISAGIDIGIPGHYGGNFNKIKTPSTIGEWQTGNKLRTGLQFENAGGVKENVILQKPR